MSKKVYYQVKEIEDLIESSTCIHLADGRKFYNLPFWFEEKPGGGYFIHHFNDIPKELQEFITKARLGSYNPQSEQSDEIST